MWRSAAASLALFAVASFCAIASDGPIERATLRGLKALRVAVDPPDAEMRRAGLTATKLTTMVEERMQKDGVPIDTNAVEFLGLRITAAHANRKQPSAVCLTLGLYQNVTLVRDPKVKATLETWSGDSVVLSPAELFHEAVSNTVNQLVDQFANAYRQANPKEP